MPRCRVSEKISGAHLDFNDSVFTKTVAPQNESEFGHKKVNLAMDVYNRSNLQDFEQALRSTVSRSQLLPSCDPKQ